MRILISVASEREFRATKRAPMVRRAKSEVTKELPPERKKQILIKNLTNAMNKKHYYDERARIFADNLERRQRRGEKISATELKKEKKKIADYVEMAKNSAKNYDSALAAIKESGLKFTKSELPNEKERKKESDLNFERYKAREDAYDAKLAKEKAKADAKTPSTYSIVKLSGDNMYDVKKDGKRVATVKTTQIKTTLRKLADAGLNTTQIKKVFKLLGMKYPT